MGQDLQKNVDEYKKENRKSSVWRRIVLGLACCVVFCTTYALILPAITMKQDTFCGKEEHTHTQECYVRDPMAAVLICPLEEGAYVLADGTVVDELPTEVEATAVPAVEATETLVAEATEVPAVEVTEAPVAEATETNIVEETEIPAEEIPEEPVVESTEVTTPEPTEAPTPEPTAEPTQVPTATPVPTPHVHTAECYAYPAEDELTCTLEEGEGHTHNFLCYGSWKLACTKEEHAHSLACFSNPQADVESAVVWEQMMNSLSLKGDWTEDIVVIAKNQVGYGESTLNYQVSEGGALYGYTRYGAWNGTPYADWNTLFANFCISYAGVEGMPFAEDCFTWINELTAVNLYQSAQDDTPEKGKLLFADSDGDGMADRVGIIMETTDATEEVPAQIKVISGNIEDQVQCVVYESGDAQIVGYGSLPKQPAPTYQYVDSKVTVDVQLPEGTGVPRNAQLVVKTIGPEAAEYAELLAQAQAAIEGDIAQIQFYDISFYSKQNEYIPFEDWAHVTMNFGKGVVENVEEMVVLHYDEKENAPVILEDVSVAGEAVADNSAGVIYANTEPVTGTMVSFETNGFSTFAVVGVQASATYTTKIMDINNMQNLYNYVSGKGTEGIVVAIGNDFLGTEHQKSVLSNETVVVNEQNTSYDGNGNPTGTYYTQHEKMRSVAAETSFTWDTTDLTDVVISADEDLLWRVTAVEGQQDVFHIESVGNPGQYLYVGPNQTLKTTNSPNNIICEVHDGGTRMTVRSEQYYMAYYEQAQKPNQEGVTVFGTTDGYIGTSGSGYNPNSIFFCEYDMQTTQEEYVTNLDGTIAALVAVNNDIATDQTDLIYAALGSTLNSYNQENYLVGSDIWTASVSDGVLHITDERDLNNRLAWKFESAGTPGTYHVQAYNYYDSLDTVNQENTIPDNGNAGKYLNITAEGLFVSDTPQAIEVVRATLDGSCEVTQNVVCLRANVGGTYYYVQLQGNYGNRDFSSSGEFDNNANNTSAYPGNHLVLASLSDPDDVQFMEWLDEIPATEEFDAVVDALTGATNAETYALQTAERERLRQLAMEAAEYYFGTADYTSDSICALSPVQMNFIGKERIEKFLDLEWLWRKDPNVVPAATPKVTLRLFNYTELINSYYFDGDSNKALKFFSYDSEEKVEDTPRMPANGESWAEEMSPVLGEDGYPVITSIPVQVQTGTDPETGNPIMQTQWVDVQDGELDYLFGEDSDFWVTTMTDGGGLFRVDEKGYYYYFSDLNAAWYDEDEDKFTLYDVVVRPEYTRLKYGTANSDTNDSRSNFLPFDEVVGNIIYDDPALFGPGENTMGDDPDTVTSRYDNGQTVTQTAYLNSPTDLWFGMTLDYDFFIPKDATIVSEIDGQTVSEDMIFQFHGDDDVFVYIDDVLILDMGGTHAARTGTINFKTGEVYYETDLDQDGDGVPEEGVQPVYTNLRTLFTQALGEDASVAFDGNTLADNTMHNLKFFYVERGGTYSYAGIKFNMPTVPENSLMVGKERTNDADVIDAQTKYYFRIVNAANTNESYVPGGTGFSIYENGEFVGSSTVDANGVFSLEVNQTALFAGILDNSRDDKTYIVQELIPTNIDGQYQVFYRDDLNSSNTLILNKTTEGNNTIYQSAVYSVDETSANYTKNVVFTNEVVTDKLDTLNITKLAGEDTDISPDQEFRVQVRMASDRNSTLRPIPVGTQYTVSGETRTVEEEGIIPLKVGETATIVGFLSGTYWTVEEVDAMGYTPQYTGTAQYGTIEQSGKAGTFGLDDTVAFTITNHVGGILINIPISKLANGNDTSHTFDFVAELGRWDWNRTWTKIRDLNIGQITVTNEQETFGSIAVNLQDTDEDSTTNEVFIKVYERNDGGSYVYDEKFYLVVFSISEVEGELVAQIKGAHTFRANSNGSYDNLGYIYLEGGGSIRFENEKINGFTISKEVVNVSGPVDPDEVFSFEATVTYEDGTLYQNIPEGNNYTVDNGQGKVYFDLKHNESLTLQLPAGVKVTVTETTTTGYTVSHQITYGTQEPEAIVSGATTGSIAMTDAGVEVHYINRTGYELPKTGGSTAGLYRLAGALLLLAFAGGLVLRLRRKALRNS